jgi:putative DNA primase/helicase
MIDEQQIARDSWASTKSKPESVTLTLTRASDVLVKPISWLWDGYLPRGMLTLLAGLPGCGKSTLALALAATVSSAGRWPDGTPMRAPGRVLIWSSEDAPDTVLVPRLIACGADLSKVHFVDAARSPDGTTRPFDPSTDMQLLQAQVEPMHDLSLLILDPVLSAVGGDSHKAAETRRGLQAVVDMAAIRNVAVLGISHFRKGSKATDPAERVIGSQAFVALARMVLIASKVEDPDDPKNQKHIVARAKSNISPDDGGFEFHLEQSQVKAGIWAQGISWGGAITGSALALLNDAEGVDSEINDRKSGNRDAMDFVREVLTGGQVAAKEVDRQAREAGFTKKQVWTAKTRLGVKSVKSAMAGGWVWSLSKIPFDAEEYQDSPSQSEGIFEKKRNLRDENQKLGVEF